jgi:hypothetical protein
MTNVKKRLKRVNPTTQGRLCQFFSHAVFRHVGRLMQGSGLIRQKVLNYAKKWIEKINAFP